MKTKLLSSITICITLLSCSKENLDQKESPSFTGKENPKITYEEFKLWPTCDKLTFGTWEAKWDSVSLRLYNSCTGAIGKEGVMPWLPLHYTRTLRVEGDKKVFLGHSTNSIDTSFACAKGTFFMYFRSGNGTVSEDGYLEGTLENDTTIFVYCKSPMFTSYKLSDGGICYQNEAFYRLTLQSDLLVK